MTRQEIRQAECPFCHAAPRQKCYWAGRGARKKMRLGQSHFERMQAAQDLYDEIESLIDEGDLV